MCCDSEMHDELRNIEESTCPFCDQLLIEGDKEAIPCCSKQYIENNDGIYVCLNCGSVHSYDYANEFVNFYENMHKIRRKSVYHRKYHIENVLNSICYKVELTHNQRDLIYKVFDEIGTIIHLVNKNRKRMISTKFIMRKILEMMGLKCDNIPVSRSRRTIAFYNKYWASIVSLIGNKMESIISRSSDYICHQIYKSMVHNPAFV